jgi:hypothetical protein
MVVPAAPSSHAIKMAVESQYWLFPIALMIEATQSGPSLPDPHFVGRFFPSLCRRLIPF